MKKIFVLLLCLCLFPAFLMAKTEDDRRVEEEKRESLRPTEAGIEEGKAAPRPIAPIDLVYFAELMPKRVTFRYDACKALVILFGVEDQYIDLDSQVAFLREKSLLPKKFEREFNPMEPLRKGLAAHMFCNALEIKGGISLRLFGMSERYALNELVYEGIMASGNVNDIVSGDELVSALMQSVNYTLKKKK